MVLSNLVDEHKVLVMLSLLSKLDLEGTPIG